MKVTHLIRDRGKGFFFAHYYEDVTGKRCWKNFGRDRDEAERRYAEWAADKTVTPRRKIVPPEWVTQWQALKQEGMLVRDIAKRYGVSHITVHVRLRRLREDAAMGKRVTTTAVRKLLDVVAPSRCFDVDAERERAMMAELWDEPPTVIAYGNIRLPPAMFRRFWDVRGARISDGAQVDPANRELFRTVWENCTHTEPTVMMSGINFGVFDVKGLALQGAEL